MRGCVAPAHRMRTLLSAASLVRGVVLRRSAGRAAEARRDDRRWNRPSCYGGGDSHYVLHRLTPIVKGLVGTHGPTHVPPRVMACREAGGCRGRQAVRNRHRRM